MKAWICDSKAVLCVCQSWRAEGHRLINSWTVKLWLPAADGSWSWEAACAGIHLGGATKKYPIISDKVLWSTLELFPFISNVPWAACACNKKRKVHLIVSRCWCSVGCGNTSNKYLMRFSKQPWYSKPLHVWSWSQIPWTRHRHYYNFYKINPVSFSCLTK